MKKVKWREGINLRLTYRLSGYIREVKHIKKVATNNSAVNADSQLTPEWLQIEIAKQRWF